MESIFHSLILCGSEERYKSFEDAAFSSLRNYKHTKSGFVYVISNPAWKGWVKIGMAIDAEDRLKEVTRLLVRIVIISYCILFMLQIDGL